MMTRAWRPAVQLACALLCVSVALSAPTRKRLWLLRPSGELIEYDLSDFKVKQTVKVPRDVVEAPGNLQINAYGQIVFNPGIAVNPPSLSRDKLWLWNGRSALLLDRGHLERSAGGSLPETDTWCAPSGDGLHLVWFANEHRVKRDAVGAEVSRSTIFRVSQTDLNGGERTGIGTFEFPACECGTGVCSETCPEASVWTPETGVEDFFLVTHWIPGQIGSTYQASYAYSKEGGHWSSTKLPVILERVLDASPGAGVVHAVLDGGCCGWENEGDDQTLLTKEDRSTVLFDERRRYANPDYDVSFFTSEARLSPGGSSVALTIATTATSGSEIRLSDEGRHDPAELARVRREAAELPAVEVVKVRDPARPLARVPHATVAGWISDVELLIIESQALVILNVGNSTRSKTPLSVPIGARVWLR